MQVAVRGCFGKLGSEIADCLQKTKHLSLLWGVDIGKRDGVCYPVFPTLPKGGEMPDVLVDVSYHGAVEELLTWGTYYSVPLVIGTTGFTPAEKAAIAKAAHTIPIFLAENFSPGVYILTEFALRLAKIYPLGDIEIVETHRKGKLDAPSGTALALKEKLEEGNGRQVGVHALRMGEVVGEHTLYLTTPNEGLILRHTAHTRWVFAEGAVRAVEFLKDKGPGLWGMRELLGGSYENTVYPHGWGGE